MNRLDLDPRGPGRTRGVVDSNKGKDIVGYSCFLCIYKNVMLTSSRSGTVKAKDNKHRSTKCQLKYVRTWARNLYALWEINILNLMCTHKYPICMCEIFCRYHFIET